MGKAAMVAAVLAFALWPPHLRAQPQPDVFVQAASLKPGDRDGRLVLDALFDKPGAVENLRTALTAGSADAALKTKGWPFLCKHDYLTGHYDAAISDCTQAIGAAPATAKDSKDHLALARLLARAPPPRLSGASARVAIAEGRIAVSVGGTAVMAVPDTGAEISVMMQSVAAKAHVRILGPSTPVGTTTQSVRGSIGVIPRTVIGRAVLTSIPVLVLPDAKLTFAGGQFKLPFILGLYALREFGRIAWLRHASVLALGDAAPAPGSHAVPVFWHPLGIGVPLDGPRGRRAAHFDTGANRSYLFTPALAIVSAGQAAGIETATRRIGGVGGVVTQQIHRLPEVTLRLAGQTLAFKNMDVASPTKSGEAARLGSDIFEQLGTVVLDFDSMRLSVEPNPPVNR